MRSQKEMYLYLKENLLSHIVEIQNNFIIAKKKKGYSSRSFSSFKLTYLKNGEVSFKSTSYDSRTLRFKSDDDIKIQLGSVANFKDFQFA